MGSWPFPHELEWTGKACQGKKYNLLQNKLFTDVKSFITFAPDWKALAATSSLAYFIFSLMTKKFLNIKPSYEKIGSNLQMFAIKKSYHWETFPVQPNVYG